MSPYFKCLHAFLIFLFCELMKYWSNMYTCKQITEVSESEPFPQSCVCVTCLSLSLSLSLTALTLSVKILGTFDIKQLFCFPSRSQLFCFPSRSQLFLLFQLVPLGHTHTHTPSESAAVPQEHTHVCCSSIISAVCANYRRLLTQNVFLSFSYVNMQ